MTFPRDAHQLPVTEATRRGVAGPLADAENEGLLLVTRHDQPVAAVLSVGWLAGIEEAVGDLLDLALVRARVPTDTGVTAPRSTMCLPRSDTTESRSPTPTTDDGPVSGFTRGLSPVEAQHTRRRGLARGGGSAMCGSSDEPPGSGPFGVGREQDVAREGVPDISSSAIRRHIAVEGLRSAGCTGGDR